MFFLNLPITYLYPKQTFGLVTPIGVIPETNDWYLHLSNVVNFLLQSAKGRNFFCTYVRINFDALTAFMS